MKKIIMILLMALYSFNGYSQEAITVFQKDSLVWTNDVENSNIYPVSEKEREKFNNEIMTHIVHPELGIISSMLTDTRRVLIFVKPFSGVDYNSFANYFLKWMTGGLRNFIFVPYGVIIIDENELSNIDKNKSYKSFNVIGKAYLKK